MKDERNLSPGTIIFRTKSGSLLFDHAHLILLCGLWILAIGLKIYNHYHRNLPYDLYFYINLGWILTTSILIWRLGAQVGSKIEISDSVIRKRNWMGRIQFDRKLNEVTALIIRLTFFKNPMDYEIRFANQKRVRIQPDIENLEKLIELIENKAGMVFESQAKATNHKIKSREI
jgi:hypothetical protein